MKKLYDNILGQKKLWNYYNKEIEKPDLTDATNCRKFIEAYMNYGGKTENYVN